MKTAISIAAQLRQFRLVPVIVIDDPASAPALGRALSVGGLPCAEVTFRTSGASEALARLAGECPDVLAGAGTVLTPAQAKDARDAGAKFVVSPGFNPAVVDYCLENDIPVFPGIATPSEIEAALTRGLNVLKFFPAEPLGGIGYLKAISAPYGGISFMPTGGISLQNVGAYLSFPRVVACGGSWMASAEWIAAKEFDKITAEVARAVAAVQPTNGASGQ
ncbi:MAG: bifunctional 4-hydroxy-2-oxoglutarate aldolase/2-dehydro-3-deoxy-phosphogluconate aldolase [Gemmatimonadales bacterium]